MVHLNNDWDEILKDEFSSEYYLSLRQFLKQQYSTTRVYPHMNDIFNALKLTAYADVKVVLLGQDPYHGEGQAHGLAFSVKVDVPPPPSLVNMFKELYTDLDVTPPASGDLTGWARQGVLLLNTTLTVRAGEPMSHAKQGWETFTDNVIKHLNERETPVIFMLWGKHAQDKQRLITGDRHYILKAPHPSPLSASRGFFGCGHFSKANEILEGLSVAPINWRL